MLRATTLFMLLWSTFALHAQLTCDDQFLLSGSSTYVGDCIQLTPSSTNQQGCTWLDVPIDFTQPFTHNMTMNFGNIDANGADGICLVYQTNGTNVCGEGGGGIGSANIFNSFIVEFDTWDNGASRDDIPNDHAAIDINGDNTSAINGPFDLGNIEDGQDHTVTFRWDPSANYYEVSFDGSIILSGNFDIINNCFGGNTMAFWGYTASTGAATNIHTICPQLAPEVITDAGPDALLPCVGASTTLDGSLSDVGPDFIYEWTTINGNILFGEDSPFPTVDAPGTYILTVTNLTTNCSSTDEVTVSQNVLVADITPPNYLDCYTGIVSLDGSGSSNGPNISYSWSTPDGNIVIENGASAEVDAEGEYTLTVIYDDGQTLCEESTTVNVTMDPDVPMAIADEAILYCNPPTTFIIGAASSQGSHYVYEWITNDGNIVAGAFSLFPEVDQPGYYTLIVTNQVSGCTDMTEVYVADFTTPPNASAEVNGVLDCSTPTVVIDGSFSDQGPEYTYEWGTNGGNIVSGQFTDNITVDAAGFYNLTVTNTTTGCTGETSVQVSEGPGGIVALAGVNEVVTCATTAVTLDGTGSSTGNDITYAWTTTDGALSGPTDGIQAMATAAGTYTLLVSDPVGGCSASVEVTVTDDLAEPQIDAGPSQELDCGVTSVLLAGVDNQAGSTATYQWTTTDGLILSGATTLTPEVGSPGTYVLTATSPENGCTASDEVVVIGDAATPTVVIVADDILDCLTTDMVLDASNSSQGDNFSFTWSTADGTFFGDPNASLTPTVTGPGTYTLMITNTDNDCSSMTSVTVTEDVLAPHVEIVEPDTLDCANATQLLDASASDQGPNFMYDWTLPDNTTTGGPDEDTLLASLPGSYQLVVTDTQNGCTSMTSVMVAQDTVAPQVSLASPDTLNCLNATTTLAATTATSPAQFSWTTANGQLISGATTAQPAVGAGGTYTLLLTDPANQCTTTASLTVLQDTIAPTAMAGPAATLNCLQPSLTLGQGSENDAWTYQWSSANGHFLSAVDSLAVAVDSSGSYQLLVTNPVNGCTAMDSVVISADFTTPMALIEPAGQLTCTDTLLVLDASASTQMAGVSYQWSTSTGSILDGDTTLMPTISQSGPYVLAVTQLSSGCVARDTVVVGQDENFPMASISPPADLTCNQTSVVLAGSASSQSGNLSISWSSPNGSIVSGQNSLTPTVDAPGTYQLRITDSDNNCQTVASVTVALDTLPPIADAGIADTLTCLLTNLQLDGSASSQGNDFSYSWSTVDGQITTGDQTLLPSVDAPGTYQLMVTNQVNGCTASASVAIALDTISPVVVLASPDTLDCNLTSFDLDASASDNGPAFQYSWSTDEIGVITAGADTPTPTIATPGEYKLLLINTENGCESEGGLSVVQDTLAPTVNITAGGTLTCATTSLDLSATGSDNGANYDLNWTTDTGNILSGGATLTPTVDAPGNYVLSIANLQNGCVAMASANVGLDTLSPVLTSAAMPTLTCAQTTAMLPVNLTDGGNAPLISWTTIDGEILFGDTGLTPTVGAPGTYALSVQNPDNGCAANLALSVGLDTLAPTVQIAIPATLTCITTTLQLDAGSSDQGPGFQLSWTTSNGNIINGSQGTNPTVDAAGDYQLTIENTTNGCIETASVSVSQDTIAPMVAIATPDTLNCLLTSTALDGSASSSGPGFQYQWSSTDGNFSGPLNGPMATGTAAGTYALLVTNANNGCSESATVVVASNTELPAISILPPGDLTCTTTELTLDASASDAGLEINWSTTDGQFTTGVQSLMPGIGAAGVYTLSLLNPTNGCEASASVTVGENTTPPVADAGPDFVLSCFADEAMLDGSGSSTGPAFSYTWTSTNGTFNGDPNSLSPPIGSAGTYALLVTNTSNGCTATDAVNVEEERPTASVEVLPPLCYGETGSIVVTGVVGGMSPYLYALEGQPFQTSNLFGNLSAGVYTVTVQDVNGCTFAEELEITQPDSLFLVISDPEPIVLGDSVQILVQSSIDPELLQDIKWTHDGSLSCDTCLNPIATPLATANYLVSVVDSNGCPAEARLRIIVDRRRSIYIPTAFSPNGDGNNDYFYIFARPGQVAKINHLEIFNRWGESVYYIGNAQPNDPTAGWDGTFRNQRLNSAVFVYYAEIEFTDGTVELFKGDVILVQD